MELAVRGRLASLGVETAVEKRRRRSGASHSEPKLEIYKSKNTGWVYTGLSGMTHNGNPGVLVVARKALRNPA
jgi:hypothetical protein